MVWAQSSKLEVLRFGVHGLSGDVFVYRVLGFLSGSFEVLYPRSPATCIVGDCPLHPKNNLIAPITYI